MNQRIDHTNYEAWLLDRLEGNLSPEQEAAMDAFLAANPGLAPIDNDLPSIKATDLPSFDKQLLKRTFPPQGSVTETSIDDHLIARLEGDLTPEQLLALEKFLYEHPEYAKADRIYALTKLVPQAMAFVAKQELERQLPPEGLVTKYTLHDHLIARLEGDLSDQQERALQNYLKQDQAAQKAWRIMSRTKISADPIVYPQKGSLKKGGRVIAISFQRTAIRFAAAASVAVLLGLGLWTLTGTPDGSHSLADVRKAVNVRETPANGTDATEATRIEVGTNAEAQDSTSPVKEPVLIDALASSPASNEPLIASNTEDASNERASDPIGTDDREDDPEQDPIDRVVPQPADQLPVIPASSELEHSPLTANVEAVPVTFVEDPAIAPAGNNERGLSALVAAALRDKVLDKPVEETRPLDGSDALAMVDKGLKAVAGENAGVAVQRADGRVRGFNIRVGNFAVSTGTGL